MEIAVIVLSYNGLSDTLLCLSTLLQQATDELDIVVVDNASTDGSVEAIRETFPGIKLIELSENRGWAGGNNVGIQYALARGAEMICLLNNDTLVPQGTVAAIAEATRRLAPCLMHCCLDYVDPAEGAQLDPKLSGQPRHPNYEDIYEMDYAYGACLTVSSVIFRSIGAFDERFFLQLEETDFWKRAERNGYHSYCTINARVTHKESRSYGAKVSPIKTYYIVRNSLLIMRKHQGKLWRTIRALYWTVAEQSRREERDNAPVPLWKWPWSKNPYIIAARAGVFSFLQKRFGQASPDLFARLERHIRGPSK